MSALPLLNLSILGADERQSVIDDLAQVEQIIVTDGRIIAMDAEGNELPAYLDAMGGVIRYDNGPGVYRLRLAEGEEPPEDQKKPTTMGSMIADVWRQRTGTRTDADIISDFKSAGTAGVYASRRQALTDPA